MNQIQKRKRTPETFTAYRVEEPKPKKEYDWDYFPLHLQAGIMVLIGLLIPMVFIVLLVALFGWYSPLIIAGAWGAGWVIWRIGRLAMGDF